jgi:hypothetical protein
VKTAGPLPMEARKLDCRKIDQTEGMRSRGGLKRAIEFVVADLSGSKLREMYKQVPCVHSVRTFWGPSDIAGDPFTRECDSY